MNSAAFAVKEWIDRLASALRKLAEAQEPYLKEYYRQNPPTYVLVRRVGALSDRRSRWTICATSMPWRAAATS